MTKSYSELMKLNSFDERFEYLRLNGKVGEETFGHYRYLHQRYFQTNRQWRLFRNQIIVRDNGCDLGLEGYDIFDSIIIHHINPLTIDDILEQRSCILDPENVICTRMSTHNAIHYGTDILKPITYKERKPNDTRLW